jgi:hypothetical protein
VTPPDSSRTFSPFKRPTGYDYPWPTIVPLTDAETGIEAVDGKYQAWDGVRGPSLVVGADGRRVVEYMDIDRVDYIALPGTMTIAQLAKVDLAETQARVLAMGAVYWALGIRDPAYRKKFPKGRRAINELIKDKAGWAVISFRHVRAEDAAELAEAQKAAGQLGGGSGPRYRFHLIRPLAQTRHPTDLKRVHVSIKEEAVAYVDGLEVLLRRGEKGPWKRDDSILKSWSSAAGPRAAPRPSPARRPDCAPR